MPGGRRSSGSSSSKTKRGGVGSRGVPGKKQGRRETGSSSSSITPPVMKPKAGAAKAKKYLAKSSGTTTGEVRGVLKQLRSGQISKGTAIKRLKGGPTAGVPAGNKKRVARAIRRAR